MSLFYNDAVAVLRPAARANRAGDLVLDYAALLAAALADPALGTSRPAVQVRPVAQAEKLGDDRASTTSDFRLATEPGSGDWDLRSTDWVRLPNGALCSVIGDVARPSDPMGGGLHHVEALVRTVRG